MENIELKYFKNLIIYSVILGALSALLSLIPVFMPFFSLFFLPFLGTIPPLILIVKLNEFYSSENKTYAILGGISGVFICFSYFIVFVPAVFLLHIIFKNYYDYGIQYLNLFLFVLFFIMVEIVYIITNIVSGLLFGIIYKYIKENNKKNPSV